MIERFVPRRELNARERMAAFIDHARHGVAAFGSDLDWDRVDWDVTRFCPKPVGKAARRSVLYFTTHENGTAKSAAGRIPMNEPFASFIKAVVRCSQEKKLKSDAPLNRIINASRDLHGLLAHRDFDPIRLTSEDFAAAARLAQQRAEPTTAYRLGSALQQIAEVIDKRRLTPSPLNWRNPLQRMTNARSRIGQQADESRDNKLPSSEVLDEIARLSHFVSEPRDILLMAAIKLLHCAPWRIGEVLALADDCEVEEQKKDGNGPVFDDAGEPVVRYGLRYWKEKSDNASIKWIPTVMVDTAKQAVAAIRAITQPARELARWLEENSGRAWLPGPDLGPNQLYTKAEIAEMFGMGSDHKAGRQWLQARGLIQPGVRDPRFRRADIEAALLNKMVETPEDRRRLKLSQHLFLTFANFFHSAKATNPCLLSLTRDQHIGDFLSGRASSRGKTMSVFERLNSPPCSDGTPMRMNSHQFRHWLNTLAQSGGLDQTLIARWSGRDDVRQNSEYDHLTGLELADRFKGMMENGEILGALAEAHKRKDPVEREGFRDAVFATAHVTEIGLCDLDWTASVCPQFEACETCEFCLVEKGNEGSKERTEERLADHQWLLERTQAEVAEGTCGASNHLNALQQSIAGCERILAIHADDSIPEGTLVQPTAASPQHFAGPGLEDAA